ncbi:uncharacterized protein MYCFIDRAFT_178331 [Pseudocercospora fijiensis CIRAD86]|uniref:Uncharacterized protein n=1 Tax=Pseudocercospora fijiensis (strain CIRAD86) TaxID=383855 RepID=M3AQU1_PSEFD|nr:uncharacterized protein MYCFIDRAFT_178331 [Pseudocercospora fijiensis CIRAD86]EME79772.1 hypothetical protein MYCFIDRAFT_178331 [Pseudocercospora fijiensis CIRAD86]
MIRLVPKRNIFQILLAVKKDPKSLAVKCGIVIIPQSRGQQVGNPAFGLHAHRPVAAELTGLCEELELRLGIEFKANVPSIAFCLLLYNAVNHNQQSEICYTGNSLKR